MYPFSGKAPKTCRSQNCKVDHIIYEIADLTVLFWVISQKCSEITDFKDFEETFRNECSERNERRGTVARSEAGSPLGCRAEDDGAPKRMNRAE